MIFTMAKLVDLVNDGLCKNCTWLPWIIVDSTHRSIHKVNFAAFYCMAKRDSDWLAVATC